MSNFGIWRVTKGKGDRHYINCSDSEKIMHPDLICKDGGLGTYGYAPLKELAAAIILFEKERNVEDSIHRLVEIEIEDKLKNSLH